MKHPCKQPLPPALRASLEAEPADVHADLVRMWDLAGLAYEKIPSDATCKQLGAEIWSTLEAAIQEETPAVRPLRRADRTATRPALRLVRPQTLRWMALAACFTLLAVVGLSLWTQPITVTAPAGDIAEATLPDGSQIILNSGSTLSYSRGFGNDTRTVSLTGEAFFDVQKATTPFVVNTFNGSTTVLGTEFNVRAWPDDPAPATQVAVVSGVVRLTSESGSFVTLTAGEASALAQHASAPTAPASVETDFALAWQKNGFKFTSTPLGTLLREVERRYDVAIHVSDKSLLLEPVDILIEKSLGAEEILRDISEYNGFAFRAVDGGYELYRSPVQ